MAAFASRRRDLTAAGLGLAAGLLAALAIKPAAASVWEFVRRGYEAGQFSFFLC
jgi:hypothetical protein